MVRLPNDKEHSQISRHHCLVVINPPDIRVRNFGSLNGTYVNDKRIGRRKKHQTVGEAANLSFPQYDLHDGDKIRLGNTVFEVGIFIPIICVECDREISEKEKAAARVKDGVYLCETCRKKVERANQKPPQDPKPKTCVICGKDVSKEVGNRQGNYVCASCKNDPIKIIQCMIMGVRKNTSVLPEIKEYDIERELGRGGMGAVFLARHKLTDKQVALKVMLPQVAVDKRAEEGFLREARVTRALKHPNVVQLHD